MKYIDTHAHVNFNSYKDDCIEVLERSLNLGVGVINVGSQFSTSQRAVELAERLENVWAVIGVHPLHLREQTFDHHDDNELPAVEIKTRGEKPDLEAYFELGKSPKVVAIGEVGLDYHHFEAGDDIEALTKKQKETLIDFIHLANRLNKPIALHCWDAYSDLLEILKTHPVKKCGVIHSFIGSYKTAKKFIELGYLISLNGVITYADGFDRLVKEIGLEYMMLETDCPYLTPVPFKGERNEPYRVELVAEKIASLKGVSIEEVAKVTTENAIKLFGLK